MFSNKKITKKTIFYTKDRRLYRELGLNDIFGPFSIDLNNLEHVKDYFVTYESDTDDYSDKIKKALEIIEKELEEVDEVQVLMDVV